MKENKLMQAMEDTNRGKGRLGEKVIHRSLSESFRVFHIETDTMKHNENISDAHLRIIAFNNSCI